MIRHLTIEMMAEEYAQDIYETVSTWPYNKQPKQYSSSVNCIVNDWCDNWCLEMDYPLTEQEKEQLKDIAEQKLNNYWLAD